MGEHDRPDLHGADTALQVEGCRQGLAGELGLGDMSQKVAGIQVDGMPAGRLNDGNAGGARQLSQVGALPQAVGQVVLLQPFP